MPRKITYAHIENEGYVATVSASDGVAITALLNNNYCRVKRSYPKPECLPNEICSPEEGHFVTECSVDGCEKFN